MLRLRVLRMDVTDDVATAPLNDDAMLDHKFRP